jgi:hypothetical protein
MRWVAAESNLYTDVSTDGGATWTNLWSPVTNPFSMGSSDSFSCAIYGQSTGRQIAISDNLYCDNFQATTLTDVNTLTTSVVGGHGVIAPTPGGTHDYGVVVSLAATPDAGYQVKAWSGTDDDSFTANANAVTMDGDKTVSVEFELLTLTLLHDWNGDGIRSIIGDVPGFVNAVYFNQYPDGWSPEQRLAVGDSNGDGILSIIGDVPGFVNCVYFGNCGE